MVTCHMKFISLVGLFACISTSSGQCDLRDDLAFIMRTNPNEIRGSTARVRLTGDQTSEFRMAMTGTIRLYQLLISSQDLSVCIFRPSCSHFGMNAISQFGPIHGVFMTADRLLRCNGLARGYYPYDPRSGKSIDYPTEYYFIFNRDEVSGIDGQ
jgi:putative membrane protein insertion efficiency factor